MNTTKQEAKRYLLKLIDSLKYPRVYTVLRHVSQSGMTRYIDLYVIKDDQPIYISGSVADILGRKLANKASGGVKITGCGMDMGFSLVYDLSMALYCEAKYDHDLAYKIKQQWL